MTFELKCEGLTAQQPDQYLDFTDRVSAHLPDFVALRAQAESTDEALVSIAALLDVDEAEVMVGLARFDLLSLTRPAGAARAQNLADLNGG